MDTFYEKLDIRSYRSLEWDRLKTFLAREALCARAREECLNLVSASDPDHVDSLLLETEESLSLVSNGASLLVDIIPDLTELLLKVSREARLSPEELLSIRDVLGITKKVNASFRLLEEDSFPCLLSYAPKLSNLDSIRRALESCLDDSGAIKDDASSHLRGIRRNIRRVHSDIKEELGRLMHSSSSNIAKALQETIITQRNGRYVLPVTASKRNTVNGIVHDTSQSGLTVYIEPMSVVEPTNKIRMLESEEMREIERILDELCQLVKDELPQINSNFETLVQLDVIQARAKLAKRYDGIKPELSSDDTILLIESRHPLLVLQGDKVVANTFTLGGEDRTLVITGPNTGGKTVLLKQVGLMAMMVKAGLLLPAKPGSSIAVFKRIWADIGDEQSLEQSLSTFSSHLQNIVSICGGAKKGILILLDEIGVGTDPKEGAAIAQAVLEHLNDSGALAVTTTHYTDLKLLAYSGNGFVNGSLEFNEATFAPTYKLRQGVPGSSKGIVIAERLGLISSIVSRARTIIDREGADLEQVLGELEAKIDSFSVKESELNYQFEQLQAQRDALIISEEKLNKKQLALENEYAGKISQEFLDAQSKIKSLVRDLQRNPDLKKTHILKSQLEKIRKDLDWLDKVESEVKQDSPLTPDKLQTGQRVKVRSLNQTGTVEEILNPSGVDNVFLATILCGSVKVKVKSSDLDLMPNQGPVSKNKKFAKTRRGSDYGKATSNSSAVPTRELAEFIRTSNNTLDLRGKRVEEALVLTDQFLDQCLVALFNPIMIIHGHGTGAIKKAVREHLKLSRCIKDFRPGEMHEGGDGVTVVNLA